MKSKLTIIIVIILIYPFLGIISYHYNPDELTKNYVLKYLRYKITSGGYPGLKDINSTDIYMMENEILTESFRMNKYSVVCLTQDQLSQLLLNGDIYLGEIDHHYHQDGKNIVMISNWPKLAPNSNNWYCSGGEEWYSFEKCFWKSLITPWDPWLINNIRSVIG